VFESNTIDEMRGFPGACGWRHRAKWKRYCRILHMFKRKTTVPTELTRCGGLAIAMEKEEQGMHQTKDQATDLRTNQSTDQTSRAKSSS